MKGKARFKKYWLVTWQAPECQPETFILDCDPVNYLAKEGRCMFSKELYALLLVLRINKEQYVKLKELGY